MWYLRNEMSKYLVPCKGQTDYIIFTQAGEGKNETKEISCEAHGSGKETTSRHNEKGQPSGKTDY
jgi:hypothetical protein